MIRGKGSGSTLKTRGRRYQERTDQLVQASPLMTDWALLDPKERPEWRLRINPQELFFFFFVACIPWRGCSDYETDANGTLGAWLQRINEPWQKLGSFEFSSCEFQNTASRNERGYVVNAPMLSLVERIQSYEFFSLLFGWA